MSKKLNETEIAKFLYELRPLLFRLLLAILLAFPITTLLISIIYLLVPKDSWIVIHSVPDNFAMYESRNVAYTVETDNLRFVNNACISLSEDCLIYLYDEAGRLLCEPGQYSHIILKNEIPLPKNVDSSTQSLLMNFSSQVVFENETGFEENEFPMSNILFENGRFVYENIDTLGYTKRYENTFAVLRDNDSKERSLEEFFFSTVNIPGDTDVVLLGTYQLYSRNGDCIVTSEDCSQLVIEIISDTLLTAQYEGVVSEIEWEKDSVNVLGHPRRFGVSARDVDDKLIYTYLDSQVEYKIGAADISAVSKKNNCFYADFALQGGVAEYHIEGSAQDVLLANKPLAYNPRIFIAENASALIISIFTAIMGLFITLARDSKEGSADE